MSASERPGSTLETGDPLAALVGQAVEIERTVTEHDLLAFAELSGDFAPQHVDEEYARATSLGGRIAHGALLVGYASAASTALASRTPQQVVSAGYDRVRFIKPVFIGDRIVVRYAVTGFDPARRRTTAQIEFTNQDGTLVAVATHLLQAWSPESGPTYTPGRPPEPRSTGRPPSSQTTRTETDQSRPPRTANQ
jgi:3-hydroxybutyryl-CoA dehydratase